MIRDRLPRDLGPLVAILGRLDHPEPGWTDARRRAWLTAETADVTWVFDQAPVSVTPTDNLAGQVRLRRLAGTSYGRAVTDRLTLDDGDDPWLLDQLVLRPGEHELGIARFLLREAVRHVTDRGGRAVVDLDSCRLPSVDVPALLTRRGFVPACGPGGGSLWILTPILSADK